MTHVESARDALDGWRRDRDRDRWADDPLLQRLVRRHLGDDGLADLEPRIRWLGERLDRAHDERVTRCNLDENLPRVRRHDSHGHPVEAVEFHPDHHEIGRVFWGSGVLAVLAEPDGQVRCGTLAYLLDQSGEAGHACPVACTAGAVHLITTVGSDAQRERWLAPLLETDYDRRVHAAQFVTEVQGGSDVGLNEVRAVRDDTAPGGWRLWGEKWFCSVADASLFVVSARPDDAPEGTRGLGLFLVPRHLEGRPNGFQLRRLKVKLGTRSMPTGEIELDGAAAEPIGPLTDGFRNLVGVVLDTSRVHNAVAACGIMRRALVEARGYAARRVAFERPVLDFPATGRLVARMAVRTAAGLASTFRVLALGDKVAREADPTLVGARRLAVMVNKYWTAIHATRVTRDGIEVLGGNGTIEDYSPLPRLYRDAIVVESWEGTHNTLCAQILRDMAARGLHQAWLELVGREIEALETAGEPTAATARQLETDLTERIERLLGADPVTAAGWIRPVVDRMAVLTDWVVLATQAAWDRQHEQAGQVERLLELYRRLEIDPTDPMDDPGRAELERRIVSEI